MLLGTWTPRREYLDPQCQGLQATAPEGKWHSLVSFRATGFISHKYIGSGFGSAVTVCFEYLQCSLNINKASATIRNAHPFAQVRRFFTLNLVSQVYTPETWVSHPRSPQAPNFSSAEKAAAFEGTVAFLGARWPLCRH